MKFPLVERSKTSSQTFPTKEKRVDGLWGVRWIEGIKRRAVFGYLTSSKRIYQKKKKRGLTGRNIWSPCLLLSSNKIPIGECIFRHLGGSSSAVQRVLPQESWIQAISFDTVWVFDLFIYLFIHIFIKKKSWKPPILASSWEPTTPPADLRGSTMHSIFQKDG